MPLVAFSNLDSEWIGCKPIDKTVMIEQLQLIKSNPVLVLNLGVYYHIWWYWFGQKQA